MNELIKINYENADRPTVLGRDLHEVLEIKTAYKDWFPRMCEYGFIEGEDFCSILSKSTGGRPSTDHQLTIDMAKEICMIQRTDIGRKVRKYFINVENEYKEIKLTNLRESRPDKSHSLEVKEMNARVRMSNQYLKLAAVDTVSQQYKNILVAKSAEILAGEPLLPLPKSEQKMYSATEIGDMFGVTAQKVGRIANLNGLKTEEYGEFYRDKSPYSSKEVDAFRYNDKAVEKFKRILT
ncbi:antA/AntB antirepressor family protein [Porcipelethomonas ammoniilytica]|uniref:antA/AntB antirepressor family protein n=1 Tax=Porcipelethomonas ammoniilytica TaxID=2981722 RepID=UPI000821E14C|nr:antA/AntB antirepressor family protein [Porcipelethomonas ammoniilytica]MCU6720698.1 antA/AntB antirepressor family protein [Porcipelethomonas ammoniilytica]SCJ22133.1 Phage anti-repressor protein [uncultured Ruminococcus sp.]